MLRICFLYLSLLVSTLSFSQEKLAGDYVEIPGTKISIVPPVGFIKAPNFTGLYHATSGSSIMITSLPVAFREMQSKLTKEAFEQQGMKVLEMKQDTVADLPAMILSSEQTARGKIVNKFIVWFGTEKETVMINVSYLLGQAEFASWIKSSILSVRYEPDRELDPFRTLHFDMNVAPSRFLVAASMASSIVFNRDGNVPTQSKDKTTLIVAKSFGNEEFIEDKRRFAINRLEQMPLDITRTDTVKEITLDEITGYEITATGKETTTGGVIKIYYILLFSNNAYYVFVGTSNGSKENLEDIKRAIRTFKRR